MTFWTGKSVLIAGGAGFLGVHLVEAVTAAGAAVDVVDNFSTSTPDAINALKLISNRQINVTQGDVAENIPLPAADVVFNLASPASPVHYQADPIKTWRTNVFGSYNLLQHAILNHAIFVQASTSEVYGSPLTHPQREEDWGNVNPNGPRSCYDEGKRAAESVLMDAQRLGLMDLRIARIFNTYGPGMSPDDGRALPQFIAQARAGLPVTLHGDGSQTRSFCYVSDMIRGLMLLAAVPGISGSVINLGNPHEISVRELAELVISCLGSSSQITLAPRPQDDPSRRCPDISQAQHKLGWKPEVALLKGLALVLQSK
jgi:nucleoside-diphosphate-sugar epimerase